MPKRSNKSKNQRKTPKVQSIRDVLPAYNPTISLNNYRLRYQCTAPSGGSVAVKVSDLVNLIVVPTVASTTIATAAYKQQICSVRLRKVQAVMPGVDGAMHTLSIRTSAGGSAPGGSQAAWKSASVLSSSDFAVVTLKPTPGTSLSWWMDALSDEDTLFVVQESGQIPVFIDIWVDIRLNMGFTTGAMTAFGSLTTSGSTPNVGQMMMRPLNASQAVSTTATLALFMGFGDDNSGAYAIYP
jgi:hypothetical protein